MLYTLFRITPPARRTKPAGGQDVHDPLFQALRVWTELGDMSESESFGTLAVFSSHNIEVDMNSRRAPENCGRTYAEYPFPPWTSQRLGAFGPFLFIILTVHESITTSDSTISPLTHDILQRTVPIPPQDAHHDPTVIQRAGPNHSPSGFLGYQRCPGAGSRARACTVDLQSASCTGLRTDQPIFVR
jgi:hypothetical protein